MRKLLVILLVGCAPSLPEANQPGALDAYRKASQGKNEDPRTHEARARLEEAQWERAQSEHSIFAYKRFLEEFPDSQRAAEARQLLEGLRWQQVEGNEASLQSYLEEEPHGAHAPQAWQWLSALRLDAAVASQDPVKLRAWLAENPAARERDYAESALDEADFGQGRMQQYLDAHPNGAHREEALQKMKEQERADARALEGGTPLEKAQALLDESRLKKLAPQFLQQLQKHPQRARLERMAQQLYLPRATLDELPPDAPSRALRLREWASALDGARLHRMLGEMSSQRMQVAFAAMEGAQQLLRGLPKREAQVRAERELKILQPLAIDGPQLAEVAVLQLALARASDALTSARNGRDLLCAVLRTRLENEPGLRDLANAAVAKGAQAIADAHLEHARAGDAAAVGEMCTAYTLVPKAAWRFKCDAPVEDMAAERREAAAALVKVRSDLARPALDRAAARDPDPGVQAAIQSSR